MGYQGREGRGEGVVTASINPDMREPLLEFCQAMSDTSMGMEDCNYGAYACWSATDQGMPMQNAMKSKKQQTWYAWCLFCISQLMANTASPGLAD